jgi:Beta-L-arabinofuranosidase, GH127 middle domain/Beta-L-arabinofuranosidase, GH127 catalytic domain/3-keto-disaccharide hydrolase
MHTQAYDWTDIYTHNRFMDFGTDFMPRHGVNVTEAMKMPPVWSQRSGDPADRDAFRIGLAHLLRGTTFPLDVLTGTEMLSGRSAIQGVETCAIVEQMLSDETAFAILGDPAITDALERTAYNALPGAMTKDLKLYQYYTATNNVIAVRGGHGFDQDYADCMMPGPVSGFPCCCYNLHMGWPMLVQHAWMETADGGLAPVIYGPTIVHADLPQAGDVTIAEQTNYPFDGSIHLTFSLARAAKFPLKLRVPGWCSKAAMSVNGQSQPQPAAGEFVTLDRTWADGDRVDLSLPMPLSTIPGVNRSISLSRGPLVFSLKMPQRKKIVKAGPDGFVQLELTSPDPWNFALNVDPSHLADTVAVHTAPLPKGSPFQPNVSPVTLSVPGRRVPSWGMNWTGRSVEDPPVSPVSSNQPEQTVTLVPFGAQTLRVTAFPWLGRPAAPSREYRCDFHDRDAPGWVTYGGSWDVQGSRLSAPFDAGTAGVKAVATATDFADFTYDADVTPASSGDTGLIFRVTRPSLGDNAFDGYYVGVSPKDHRIALGKCSAADNGWTPLADAALAVPAGKPVHFRVVATGPVIRVFVGDAAAAILHVTDDSFTHGAIGVRRYSTGSETIRASFANLSVTSSPASQP